MKGLWKLKFMMLALLIAFPGAGQAADSLMIFRAGDTAKASAVNANFRLLWDRLQSLAAENKLLSTDNLTLKNRVDSVSTRLGGLSAEQARQADSLARLAASLAGKANASHTHPISQVSGLQDSLKARLVSVNGPLKVCTGITQPGDEWSTFDDYDIFIVVNTSACGFTQTPKYITSLSATKNIGKTTGASSVHAPSPTSFKIHIALRPWASTPAQPEPKNWDMQVNWVAIGQ